MIKDIKFKGYTQVPNEYETPDGELDGAIGLVPEKGAIRAVFPAKSILHLSQGDVVFVHDPSYTHYIISMGSGVYKWMNQGGTTTTDLISLGTHEVYQITSVGNTLIFLADDGMHYLLWKDSNYTNLGTHIPELPLSFGLQGVIKKGEEFDITFDDISEEDIFDKDFTDENKRTITNQVLAKVNKFIAEESTNKGRFLFPFFVRYAYRLYDGTLTMHSAPILMVASSDLAPQVAWSYLGGKGSYQKATLMVLGMLHKLDVAVVSQDTTNFMTELNKWSDIVSSVDVFISKPIYTYDQAGECTRFVKTDTSDSYSVCKMTGGEGTGALPCNNLPYQKYELSFMYALAFDQQTYKAPASRLLLPRKTLETIGEEIRNCAQFYFLRSFKLSELSTTRQVIDIPEDYLQSLVAREVMTDDYDSHDKLVASHAFGFNSRLNLANIQKELFEGFNAGACFPHTKDVITAWQPNGQITVSQNNANVNCVVAIKQNGKEYLVDGGTCYFTENHPYLFFYYPNPNAYKVYICQSYGGYRNIVLPLEKHAMLNGAFCFTGWNPSYTYGDYPSESPDKMVSLPNKVYTSEVNNPFYFPLLGINTIGTGTILGICAATKALSQGQFGQFPLYAFTTEGVWALETNTNGTYSARQPITRDVCINSKSIMQLDNSVLFTTARGVMMLSGSQSSCITDVLDGDSDFLPTQLPKLTNAFNTSSISNMVSVKEYIKGCQMLYDYRHQRIILFNNLYGYAYVYSLDTNMWGMMASNLKAGVNSYPEALAMTSGGDLVDLSQHVETSAVNGLLVTRALKLDAPDVHKTIDTVITRGYFRKGHVKTILYGSRDLFNWHLVYSSQDHILRGFRGTPYKYFRIALVCSLTKDESLVGCTIQYTPRLDNQPR